MQRMQRSCVGKSCQDQNALCSVLKRGFKAAAIRPQAKVKPAGPQSLAAVRAFRNAHFTSPSSSTSSCSDCQTFIHPELMEGPLAYLPSGWSNQTPPSSSDSPVCFYPIPTQPPSLKQQQWTGQWTHQEPCSSMWDRQSSSSKWGPSLPSSSHSPGESLAPHDQNLLQTSLRKHLFRALGDLPAINLLEAGPHALGLVFRQPGHDQEGFYFLHAHAGGSQNTACEIIMVFELQEEAERYACLLEAAMEPHPHVFSISASLMVRLCREHGYECRMEPAGSRTAPPECSVTLTDWERVKSLRSGSFLVLDDEPNPAGSEQPTRRSLW